MCLQTAPALHMVSHLNVYHVLYEHMSALRAGIFCLGSVTQKEQLTCMYVSCASAHTLSKLQETFKPVEAGKIPVKPADLCNSVGLRWS